MGSVSQTVDGTKMTLRGNTTFQVERFRYRSGVDVVDGRTIVSRADTWWDAWRLFFFET